VDGHPPIGWHDAGAYLVLPLLLVASQYASQKLVTPQNTDPAQQQTQAILGFLPFMIGEYRQAHIQTQPALFVLKQPGVCWRYIQTGFEGWSVLKINPAGAQQCYGIWPAPWTNSVRLSSHANMYWLSQA